MQAEPQDLATLRSRIEGGWAPGFLFFWGHSSSPGAPLGKECLSQWYPAGFLLDGTAYATAEHYMMAKKASLFGDDRAAEEILSCTHPREAKEIGRRVRGFDGNVWEKHRFGIVAAGSHAKFSQNPALGSFLVGTGSRVLVEASPRDRVWGIGLAEQDPRIHEPQRWKGLNLLGFALMHARARLLGGEWNPRPTELGNGRRAEP